MSKPALSPVTHPVLRLTQGEFASIPIGQPVELASEAPGYRWRDFCWGGARVREFLGVGSDGYLIQSYRPIIRVQAVSRLVPRPQVVA